MRSLAARIFVAIVLTNLLVSVGVGLALEAGFERRRAEHAAIALDVLLLEGAAALEASSTEDARQALHAIESRTGVHLVLARGTTTVRSSGTLDDDLEDAAAAIEAVAHADDGRATVGEWVALRGATGDVIAASYGHPPRAVFAISPPRLHFGLVLGLAAVVSLLLAHALSAPIRSLRAAAGRVSAGDMQVRVGPSMPRHAESEVRALALDFDAMTQKVSELLASRERLLRDVSHELRSPLTRLSMALEVARHSTSPEEAEAHAALDRIGRESERLEELVALVLTMARLDDAGAIDRTELLRLDEIVADVVGDAAYEARTTGRRVEASALPEITLRGHAELLRQAIENVVRNALRFAPEGTAIEIGLGVRDRELSLTVRDHGPGVPQDKLDEIFRPFARLSPARERETGGAGLGLAITERAVRVHGGRVRAQNAEGGGLAVEITLPLDVSGSTA
ncbi:MAG: HAMP domain-containing protein [Deltaproteobacteria bacterium]|nr:HAMP domain-containing protein [Deltaproteobacteria bacterium]